MKLCKKCGLEKPKEDFNWANKAKGKLSFWCRECNKEYLKEYYKKNKEQMLEGHRKYREENKEKERKRKQEYYQENKEQMREYRQKYYQENKEQVSERRRKYREQNKEKERKSSQKYHQKNKKQVRERQKKYREENKERERKRSQKHYQENKEKYREYKLSRRARKRCTVPNNWVKRDEIKGRCYWCGDAYGDNYHLDHIMPLSLHGPHEEYNIVKTCPTCNVSKKDKHPLVWIADLVTT